MIGESLSVIMQGENSQRILLMSNHRQWLSPMSATYDNQALFPPSESTNNTFEVIFTLCKDDVIG